MTTPQRPGTAVALPETLPVLLRIYSDLLDKFARMVRETVIHTRRRGQHIPSLAECRTVIEQHVLRDPKNPGVPHVARMAFVPKMGHLTWTVHQKKDKDGNGIVDKKGDPVPWFTSVESDLITCTMPLPGSQYNPHDPRETNIQPAFCLSGMGGLLGYCPIDEQGALRMTSMMALFIARFDLWSGEETGGAWMIPLGLAEHALLDRWNRIVELRSSQGSTPWDRINPLMHAIGYRGSYVDLTPLGSPANLGLLPSFRDFNGADPQKPDGFLVADVYGKMVMMDKGSQPLVIRDGEVPTQRFAFVELLGKVLVRTLGLPEEIGSMEGIGRSLDHGEVYINMLELFGVTLYDVTPMSGTRLIRQGLQNPPMERMTVLGLIPPEATRDHAIQTLRGMNMMVRDGVERVVNQAVEDLVHYLGAAGTENPRLSLEDILGGSPNAQLLRSVLERGPTQEDILMAAILSSQTAQNLGLSLFDPKCWVTNEAWTALLIEIASAAGIKPASEDEEPAEEIDNGSSEPTILWHDGMKRDELLALAKGLEGVTSKANKTSLIEALSNVCPPSPPV